MQQLRVVFYGRVQGVGFRVSVASIASKWNVVGSVCNMSDGTVELIAQGDEAELLGFRNEISVARGHNIVSIAESWSQVETSVYPDFTIGPDKYTPRSSI